MEVATLKRQRKSIMSETNTPSSAFKEGEKKERFVVITRSIESDIFFNGYAYTIVNNAIISKTFYHTNLQRNYFKKIA